MFASATALFGAGEAPAGGPGRASAAAERMLLLLGALLCAYTVSSVMLMRAQLPVAHRGIVTAALGLEDAASDSEFDAVHRYLPASTVPHPVLPVWYHTHSARKRTLKRAPASFRYTRLLRTVSTASCWPVVRPVPRPPPALILLIVEEFGCTCHVCLTLRWYYVEPSSGRVPGLWRGGEAAGTTNVSALLTTARLTPVDTRSLLHTPAAARGARRTALRPTPIQPGARVPVSSGLQWPSPACCAVCHGVPRRRRIPPRPCET